MNRSPSVGALGPFPIRRTWQASARLRVVDDLGRALPTTQQPAPRPRASSTAGRARLARARARLTHHEGR